MFDRKRLAPRQQEAEAIGDLLRFVEEVRTLVSAIAQQVQALDARVSVIEAALDSNHEGKRLS